VQIGDENVHYVREILDEVFGRENFVTQIAVKRPTMAQKIIRNNFYYVHWYAKNINQIKSRKIFFERNQEELPGFEKKSLGFESFDGKEKRSLATEEREPERFRELLKKGRIYQLDNLIAIGSSDSSFFDYKFEEEKYSCGSKGWKTTKQGLDNLVKQNRVEARGDTLCYKNYIDDYPVVEIGNLWEDTAGPNKEVIYAVQTKDIVIHRCLLMTTDPGDLVLDPTCGSGTTAYVAEQWGRRWITIDTSRVPLALTRQRLLTATFPYYQLKDETRGPVGGFVYLRKQNKKGEEIGGIVPHITLGSAANNEPPKEEVLVDRPDIDNKITRVTGPFCVEATIPTPVDWEGDGVEDSGVGMEEQHGSFIDRMLEILRKSPVLHLGGGKSVTLKNIRPPAKTLSLSAEAVVANGDDKPVALLFGPENGAVSEKLVHEALKEANLRGYTHLYVIGVGIQSNARILIENAVDMGMIPATYVQATPDIMMGDLLQNMRSSQIFSVCGLPEVRLTKVKPSAPSPHRC
jgi:adenine-specific DNA-methyltransferase